MEVKLSGVQQQKQHLDNPGVSVVDVANTVELATEATEPQTVTETTIGTTTEAVPSPLRARGRQSIQQTDLIPFDKSCFRTTKRMEPRSIFAADMKKSRAVKKIIRAVLDKTLTAQ